jgi:TRAP-type C4-dicarboxylate transport system substrate-binding protein
MKRQPLFGALLGAAALGLAMATAAPTDASAKTLKSAVGLPTSSAQYFAHQRLADYVAEHSDLKIRVYSMSLLNLKETPPGIRDGIADMGFVLPPYFPAEYANFNLASDLSMLSTSGRQVESPGAAMGGAIMEYAFFNCPDCQKEFDQQNQIYLGSGASPAYILLCSTPVKTLEDIKGKKYRSGAANFGRWAEYFGGIKVSLPANDTYEALGQGVIDCAMNSALELTNVSLFDVTKAITLRVPGGVYPVATNNVNKDVWQTLTREQREVFLKGSARAQADLTWKYYDGSNQNLEDAPGKGIEVFDPGPEIMEKYDEFVKADLEVIGTQFTRDYGVTNAKEKIAKMVELVEKWKTLTEGLENDPEGLAQVYWDEIFAKIDIDTYGME